MRFSLPAIAAVLFSIFTATTSSAANTIFDQLTGQGVAIDADETVPLTKPLLADGLDAAAQRKAIESVLGTRYDWSDFTRKSVVSPLLLKIDDGKRESGQLSRRVDLYFVTYGSLDTLRDDKELQERLNLATAGDSEAGNQIVMLTDAELAERGLSAENTKWIAIETTLLNKVRLSITTRNEKTENDDSLLVATLLDPKFAADAKYPNSWSAVTTDDAGRRQVGNSHPYAGLASYMKTTKLAAPAGAIFVEYHVVYSEPEGWFHGANLLRSKLPIVAQELVRKLRRKMGE
jgi:hypothetical protein